MDPDASRTFPRRRETDESDNDIKGPIGLTTLYEPRLNAIADLIFVHGLTEGSRSSWSKNNDPSLFWPQEWLPNDAKFEDVRIHSFGYKSKLGPESILSINDFAKSLLGAIYDCPLIPTDSDVPIVFVCHSMGGLVVKRAYILARLPDQHVGFSSIARRVKAMLFLATPHRGADNAQLLSRILSLRFNSSPFVEDLHRSSRATQDINDEFPKLCRELQLFSFYETLPTKNLGSIVVEKDLAVLGYDNERTAYLDADHGGVCKYATKRDSNYQAVRNSLAKVIDDFRSRERMSRGIIDHEKLRLLDSFLGTSDAAEDDFSRVESMRMPGSCEWLMKKTTYLDWIRSENNQLYWMSAKPATGKTILSGKVISHLKGLGKDCSFCFFDYGNKTKSNIGAFLLSMARQLAIMHSEILIAILELYNKDHYLKEKEYGTIWRILYVECILKQKLAQPQYWVVDALDECYLGPELVPMLVKVMAALPLRIFLTSRDSIQDHRVNIPPMTKVVPEEISKDDTLSDIDLYLGKHMNGLPADSQDDKEAMKQSILNKSNGCFLWVSLVLQELKHVYTADAIHAVLREVPSDMDSFYSRILEIMSHQAKGTELVKAILTWTVCAARPLTTDELRFALTAHLKMAVFDIARAIKTFCGQLVFVDAQNRVQVIHQTVRDYLLNVKSTSHFGIVKKMAHKQLALSCLEYLNGQEMQGPSRRKLGVTGMNAKERSPFAAYACNYLFEHIGQVASTDDDILEALHHFASSSHLHIFCWIEYVAKHSDLKRLIQTGKALKRLLQRRSKHVNPFFKNKEVAFLDSWATDLVRLVAKFGKNLLENPSSIYHLIPPFCPPGSGPRRLFTATTRGNSGIQLLGLSNKTWGDCLSTIVEPQEEFVSLACSMAYFAIGTKSGTIKIFNQTTCQAVKSLRNKHESSVKLLRFGLKERLLASADSKVVRIWDTESWNQQWELELRGLPMSISFAEEDTRLLISLKNNLFSTWDLTTGKRKLSGDWTRDLEGRKTLSYIRPITATCNVEERLLAVVYRGQDILLWDFDEDALLETYTKEATEESKRKNNNGGVTTAVFGTGPNHSLLAAAYVDGELVVFDTNDGSVKKKVLANAQVLAASPDGRTLAAGDSSGTIQLYDFENLKLLHRIRSDDYTIRSLKFSRDSCRILDIRGSQCQVWDPTVLVRQEVDDEISDTVSNSTAPQEVGTQPFEERTLVTSLTCPRIKDLRENEVFFVGKEDGGVYLNETRNGTQLRKLYDHGMNISIVGLHFEEDTKLLASVDTSSRVIIRQLSNAWKPGEPIFNHRVGKAVDQLLFGQRNSRVLICSALADTLWHIDIKHPELNRVIRTKFVEDTRSYRWTTHPTNSDWLLLIENKVAHIFDWQTLNELTPKNGILLDAKIHPDLLIRSITPCFYGHGVATVFGESSNRHCRSKLMVWNSRDFELESTSAVPTKKFSHLTDDIDFLIHADDQRLVFVHSDNWICSTDPDKTGNYIRHFFLPADWLTSNKDLMIGMTPAEIILFVKDDEVAVIKRGLREQTSAPTTDRERRPSPLRSPLIGGGRRFSNTSSPISPTDNNMNFLSIRERDDLVSSDEG